MKTIDQVQNEITALEEQLESISAIRRPTEFDRAAGRKVAKQLAVLRERKRYLETKPNVQFLEKQRHELRTKIEKIAHEGRRVAQGVKNKNVAASIFRHFCKEYDLPRLKKQLETLDYLLEG